MIKFTCPDFYYGFKIYEWIEYIKKEFPECLNEDIEISSLFGSLPNMIWNGGSSYFDSLIRIDEAQYYANYFAEKNLPLKLTFTNPLLTKEDCYDRYCNAIAKIFENKNNTILIASPILEDYLREKYPNYKFSKSIISSEHDYDYKEALEKYDNIVLPRRLGKNFDFLNSVEPEYRSRMEILCNDPCPINCPRLYSHYKEHARVQLYETSDAQQCSLYNGTLESIITRNSKYKNEQINIEEIREKYLPLGYDNFKLAGRLNPISVLYSTVEYLVKPEYYLDYLYYMTQLLSKG